MAHNPSKRTVEVAQNYGRILPITVLLSNNCQIFGCVKIVQHRKSAPWTILTQPGARTIPAQRAARPAKGKKWPETRVERAFRPMCSPRGAFRAPQRVLCRNCPRAQLFRNCPQREFSVLGNFITTQVLTNI